ncbi:MAG TPA: hypothetical protein VKZ49_10125 [Polyangiaceae bacterium]|nr:hypothetical protein [Polyangiaceae bacterium]
MRRFLGARLLWLAALGSCACTRAESEAQTTFYERRIAPVLAGSCAPSTTGSGCHVGADDRGNAFGNLSMESFDHLALRRDLLVDYGPYGLPGLLLKAVPPFELRLSAWNESEQVITTDVFHAGGAPIDFTSAAFTQLERWIENGASENNARPPAVAHVLQPCNPTPGADPDFDPSLQPPGADFAAFAANVSPMLGERCAASNCHGSPTNPLFLTCGTNEAQTRWNYFAASDYLSATPSSSEMLRRTLSPVQGGTYHEGGAIFSSTSDPEYRALLDWATAKGPPSDVPENAGFAFFAERVQPMLVKKGCMMLGCHSAAMGHDYRLRGGSGGHFGLPATRRNYELTLDQVALESPDPNASRLIRKNLFPPPAGDGILHRGQSLLGGSGDPSACDLEAAETGPLDAQDPYCVLVAWIAKEREERAAAPLSALVYVKRSEPPAADGPQDFEVYAPGAELVRRSLTLQDGALEVGDTEESLSASCGLEVASSDVRRPAVSWDGAQIAFSARTGAAEPWRIYVLDAEGCRVQPEIDAPAVDDGGDPVPTNGELVHNFDPTYAPDGRIVFASTRGNVQSVDNFDYAGPQRTPADPSKLNANLYVLEAGGIRQLTFLLNQELTPSFMNDGRLIMTTEKRAPGFYQLAGRRMNLDGGDYHPLFAQRSSIGYTQFTDFVENADKNFIAIASEQGAARSAGALVVINRSLGVDQHSDEPQDFLQAIDAIGWPNPAFYLSAMRLVDPAATGRLSGTSGAYRNPSPLPDGRLLVSYAPDVTDLRQIASGFDLYVVDPVHGTRQPLVETGDDLLWPVAVYGRAPRRVFRSRIAEPNGATQVGAGSRSEVFILDVPMLTSLMFQNTRGPRRVLPPGNPLLEVWESLPPEPGVHDFQSGGSYVVQDAFGSVYVRRRPLGAVQPLFDGSVRFDAPGGVPIVLATEVQLADDAAPTRHFQLEEMQFYPGESLRQSFRRELFNGICANCHGALEGVEMNAVIDPDILTAASAVAARSAPAEVLSPQGPPQGPPFP